MNKPKNIEKSPRTLDGEGDFQPTNSNNEGAVVMTTLPETIELYECEDAGNVVSSATALLKQASEELHEIIARMNKAGVDSFAELADGEGK